MDADIFIANAPTTPVVPFLELLYFWHDLNYGRAFLNRFRPMAKRAIERNVQCNSECQRQIDMALGVTINIWDSNCEYR